MSLESFFSLEQVREVLEPHLRQRLIESLNSEHYDEAADWLEAYTDLWPVGGTINRYGVVRRWAEERDGLALAILHRATEIAHMCGTHLSVEVPDTLPPHLLLDGEALASRRDEICHKVVQGELVAVHFVTPVPSDSASQLALGELRMEADKQLAVEHFGVAGLVVDEVVFWERALGRAPSGKTGERYRQCCDLAILPGTPKMLRKGESAPVSWLLWEGPAKPLPVAEVAATMVRNIAAGLDVACNAANLTLAQGRQIVNELVALGALTSVD